MRIKMAEIYSKFRIAFISILLALITACGGGAIITLVEGGISGTGISFGSILAFGSVIVNGTTLTVDNQTQIVIDGIPTPTETDLNVGYVIRVEADFDNGRANRIDYVETVRGPITTAPGLNPLINPDTLAGNFELLGQTIITNSLTVFDGIADVETLIQGDVLDVSGVRDSSRAIIARYIRLKTAPVTEYRVVGEIDTLDPVNFTFKIGNLDVDYSSVDISNLNNGNVQDGIEVRVKGLASSFIAGSILADSVSDSVLRLGFQSGDSVELEGAVTQFTSLANMEVNGFRVNATNAVIEDGDVSDIVLDALLEVEGSVDSSNILNATKVKIIPINNIRIRAPVDSVDDASDTIVVLGNTFQKNARTQLVDSSSADIRTFSLSDLSPSGDWIELRGFIKDGNNILTRLERKRLETDPPGGGGSNTVRLQAPVDVGGIDVIAHTVSLLGITVNTDSLGGFTTYQDEDDILISEVDFFAAVSVSAGQLVKAKWPPSADIFTDPADELSLELEE